MKTKFSIVLLFTLIFTLFTSTLYASPIPYKFISVDQYKQSQDKITLLDVRSVMSRSRSNLEIKDAIWIDPYSGKALEDFLSSHDKDKQYVIFCSCTEDNYSIRAAQILSKNEFKNVKVLKNGWDSIKSSDIKLTPIKGDDKK